jgi:hypothetical protein
MNPFWKLSIGGLPITVFPRPLKSCGLYLAWVQLGQFSAISMRLKQMAPLSGGAVRAACGREDAQSGTPAQRLCQSLAALPRAR